MAAIGYTGGDPNKVSVSGDTMTGVLVLDDGSPAVSEEYVAGHGGGGGTPTTGVLFSVDDHGAAGDGITDDYGAFVSAWAAVVASPLGGKLFLPRRYKVDVTSRVMVGVAGQYAVFHGPQRASDVSTPKLHIGVAGVGEAVVIRSWAGSGQDAAANATASVLEITYDDPFGWSTAHGLPALFGFSDGDLGGNSFSNIHFTVEHLILRAPQDPSLCGFNLEQCSTARVLDLFCDVAGFLDEAPEPTHPTGIPLLMPRTGNAIQVAIDQYGVWGWYGGLPITEHGSVDNAIIVRCKVGAFIRRAESAHYAHIKTLSMEQCTWGLAGLDPSGEPPNLGVVPAPGWQVKIDFWDVEDFDELPSMYTPDVGAHLYDSNNALKGGAWFGRVDSGADHGADDAAYVVGGSQFALLKIKTLTTNVTRLTGTAPDNGGIGPALSPPEAPTIGTATAGDSSATITFTPAETGDAADTFTATSTPDGHTGTGDSSPITVTGLGNGTTYTFTVHGTNDAGDGDESAPSNEVTPSAGGPVTFAADTFDRANDPLSLGTSSGGQTWTPLMGTWGILNNAGYLSADGAESYSVAVLDAGHPQATYTVDLIARSGDIDLGLAALVQDVDNLIFWDVSGDTLNTPTAITTRLFHRASGNFTGITDAATIAVHPGTATQLKMVVGPTSISCYQDGTLVFASDGATGLETQTQFGLVVAAGNADHTSVFDNLTVTS